MKREDIRSAAGVIFILVVAFGLAWAGSQGSVVRWGLPLFASEIVVAFVMQWLFFIPAFIYQTEKFYDLAGMITYLTVTVSALLLGANAGARAWLVATLVTAWTLRLGLFLFRRVLSSGKDSRFDEIKPSFPRFLMTWTLQGLWVSFTLSAALVVLTSQNQISLDAYALVGFLVWALGYGIEVVADAQKSRFRAEPANEGKFISSGLWGWSRHPNYFGEILLWVGIAIIALPVLRGWQWVALISPVFVFLLLTRISGVPILEKRADEKWGGQKEYEEYKAKTPVLLPLPPRT